MTELFRGIDWQEKRVLCLERDGFCCRACGETKNIAVHHIIPWFTSKDNSLFNLITVCSSCHTKTENEYRRCKKTAYLVHLLEFNKEFAVDNSAVPKDFLPRLFHKRYRKVNKQENKEEINGVL